MTRPIFWPAPCFALEKGFLFLGVFLTFKNRGKSFIWAYQGIKMAGKISPFSSSFVVSTGNVFPVGVFTCVLGIQHSANDKCTKFKV